MVRHCKRFTRVTLGSHDGFQCMMYHDQRRTCRGAERPELCDRSDHKCSLKPMIYAVVPSFAALTVSTDISFGLRSVVFLAQSRTQLRKLAHSARGRLPCGAVPREDYPVGSLVVPKASSPRRTTPWRRGPILPTAESASEISKNSGPASVDL
jgi:hypothetical protein